MDKTPEQLAAEAAQAEADAKAKADAKKVKARVLYDCAHGKCNDVVLVTPAELKADTGALDGDKAAVAYAESLKKAADA